MNVQRLTLMKKGVYKSLMMVIIAGICWQHVYAQDFVWARNWGKAFGNGQSAADVVRDDSGYIYTISEFTGTIDFDPGTGVSNLTSSTNAYDHALSKFDEGGNFIWVKHLDANLIVSSVTSLSTDGTHVYVARRCRTTVNPNSFTTIVGKYASNGSVLWEDTLFNGSTSATVSHVYAIVNDAGGNSYITGSFSGTVNFNPGTGTNSKTSAGEAIFVLKLNAAGEYVWVKTVGDNIPGFRGTSRDIDIDPAGGVYVTGSFGVPKAPAGDSTDFGLGAGVKYTTTKGGTDFFVLKLDTTGNHIWAKSFGGKADDNATLGVFLDFDNKYNIFINGAFQDTVDFDPGALEFKLQAQRLRGTVATNDIFLSKLDSAGNFIWAKNIVTSAGFLNNSRDIKSDIRGNVYVTGTFMGEADFDPDTSTYLLTPNGTAGYFFLSKYDNNGTLLWANKFDTSLTGLGGGMTLGAEGDVYVCGIFSGTTDFDFSTGTYDLASGGNVQNFLLKLNECHKYDDFNPIHLNGPDTVCPGGTYTYSIAAPHMLSVDWLLPDDWHGSSTGKSIDITVGDHEGIITVIVNGACDTSAPLSFPIALIMQPAIISIDEFELITASTYDTWQWYLNNDEISGATHATYTVSENGTYCVIVTKGDCTDTACYTVTNVPGDNKIGDMQSIGQSISIYPNPSDHIININSPVPVNATLTGLDGRHILTQQNAGQINVKDIVQGTYLLQVKDKEGRQLKVEIIIVR